MAAHVLVIEDDPDIREAIVSVLRDEIPWLRVSSASDGLEALEILEEEPEPCLVLLDLMMPVMNGVEFLDALKERGLSQRLRVVLVSEHPQLAKQLEQADVAALLPKPFRAVDLLDIVQRHCADGAQG